LATAARDVIVIWAISRAFYLAVGAVGHTMLPVADTGPGPGGQDIPYLPPPGPFSYWANWDGAWFTHIAQHGYDTVDATVFFPLYPFAIRVCTALAPWSALLGVLLSIAASLAGLYFVYELGAHWWSVEVARAATLTLALFPTAFYLNAVYSESLFLALTSASVWALYVRRDLLMAGIIGYFASVTRNTGVLLLVPLVGEVVQHRQRTWRTIGVLGPPLGLITYAIYLWHVGYRPFQFVTSQRTWERQRQNPLVTIRQAWEHGADGLRYITHPARIFETSAALPSSGTINFACLVLMTLLFVVAFIRLPFGLALYAGLVALSVLGVPQTAGVPLLSLPRFALASFPLFLVLGSLLGRRRVALVGWLAFTIPIGAYLTLEFVTWRWVA
jgi:Mannosyltransferase (PIG-V)